MKNRKKLIYKVVTIAVVVITLFLALWIMVRRMGLVEGLDFGAGAYYYADSPQIQDLADRVTYTTSVPRWVHIVLFLCWGWLMYRLWVWIDRK